MRNVAFSVTEEELKNALAVVLHRRPFPEAPDPLVNFDVHLFRKPGRNSGHKGCGLLTLPNTNIGNLFLRTYASAFLLRNRVITFQASNQPPDQALIAKVASTEWEEPKALQENQRKMEDASRPIPLSKFSFGRLCRDGTYSVELEHSNRSIHAICDVANRRLRVSDCISESTTSDVDTQPQDSLFAGMLSMISSLSLGTSKETINITWRANQIVSLAVPRFFDNINDYNVLIEAALPPILEMEKDSPLARALMMTSDKPLPAQRLASLDGNPMVPSTRFMLLSFHSRGDMETFLQRAGSEGIHLPRPYHKDIPIVAKSLYSLSSLRKLEADLAAIPFDLAFEIQKAIASAVLDPQEFSELAPTIDALQRDHGSDAAPILRRFLTNIWVPSIANWTPDTTGVDHRRKPRKRGRGKKKRKQKEAQELIPTANTTLTDLLLIDASEYVNDLRVPRKRFSSVLSPGVYESYTLILTPLGMVLEGPLPDQSNSVLRQFGHHECFLRVSFEDENRTPLRRDPTSGSSPEELLRTRYKSAMVQGIRLAGRQFDFLGYSMSGLKDHSTMFMTPFNSTETHERMTAALIRDRLVSASPEHTC